MGIVNSLRKLFGLPDKEEINITEQVESVIGYTFHNPALLILALTHRSFNKNKDNKYYSNERLEFLGDSVLGLVIADQLYHDHPHLREGRLTKLKALMVNETTLANIGRYYGLNNCILLSDDEEKLGGRERPSIVSDAMESIFGAVYLDGGMDAAADVVLRLIYANKETILSDKSQKNYKGELLELMQARGEGMPHYHLVDESGPDHEKKFSIDVYVGSEKVGSGAGLTKKEAEQKAASQALKKLKLKS